MNFLKSKIYPVLFLFVILCILLGAGTVLQRVRIAGNPPPIPKDFLESYFKNVREYDDSFSKYRDSPKVHVLAALTSHHFLAKDLIARIFSGIDPTGVKTIIIVSPDHFKQIDIPKILAQTTNVEWHTPFGNMDPDGKLIVAISQMDGVYSDINLFRSEHGVYTIVPFAKRTLPDAKIVPLALRQSDNYQYFYNLGEEVGTMVNRNETVLIISSDFTHYSSADQAKLNDQLSIRVLPDKKFEDIGRITNDCKQCTAFLFGYLRDTDTDFKLIDNKNSYDFSGVDPASVTSYIGAYFTPK